MHADKAEQLSIAETRPGCKGLDGSVLAGGGFPPEFREAGKVEPYDTEMRTEYAP